MEQDDEKLGKCGGCAEAVGTTAKAWMWCQFMEYQVLREAVRACFVRKCSGNENKE